MVYRDFWFKEHSGETYAVELNVNNEVVRAAGPLAPGTYTQEDFDNFNFVSDPALVAYLQRENERDRIWEMDAINYQGLATRRVQRSARLSAHHDALLGDTSKPSSHWFWVFSTPEDELIEWVQKGE
jgi:hypothetical protein